MSWQCLGTRQLEHPAAPSGAVQCLLLSDWSAPRCQNKTVKITVTVPKSFTVTPLFIDDPFHIMIQQYQHLKQTRFRFRCGKYAVKFKMNQMAVKIKQSVYYSKVAVESIIHSSNYIMICMQLRKFTVQSFQSYLLMQNIHEVSQSHHHHHQSHKTKLKL